jgi:hypothetical protein
VETRVGRDALEKKWSPDSSDRPDSSLITIPTELVRMYNS